MSDNNTLYLFVDESGNFDFSPKGTKYFTLAAVSTFNPCLFKEKILEFKYGLLKEGYNMEAFHATEDKQFIRDKMFEFIKSLSDDFFIDSVIVQKNKTNPSLYREINKKNGANIVRQVGAKLYQTTCKTLLQYVFKRHNNDSVERIVVVLGSIFTKEKHSFILKVLKPYFKYNYPKPFQIYFHQSSSDLNCQIADYCCWAISIRWERSEKRSYNILAEAKMIKSEFDMFNAGNSVYYKYSS